MTNANAFPNSNPNEKWSSAAPQRNNTIGPPGKSLLVPTTISAKMKSTLSAQTVQNVTFLLNNLLQQYDNSLRPDLGGKIRERWIPLVYEHVAHFAVYFLSCVFEKEHRKLSYALSVDHYNFIGVGEECDIFNKLHIRGKYIWMVRMRAV